jgi:hypothetical protein
LYIAYQNEAESSDRHHFRDIWGVIYVLSAGDLAINARDSISEATPLSTGRSIMLLKPKVATNISMHPDALARLHSAADVEVLLPHRERIPDILSSCQGIIIYAPSFDKALLQEAPNLKVISCHVCPLLRRRQADA